MPFFVCTACGMQHAESAQAPAHCVICEEERQYVPPRGQTWTTLDALRQSHTNTFREYEKGIIGIGSTPSFAIGQPLVFDRAEPTLQGGADGSRQAVEFKSHTVAVFGLEASMLDGLLQRYIAEQMARQRHANDRSDAAGAGRADRDSAAAVMLHYRRIHIGDAIDSLTDLLRRRILHRRSSVIHDDTAAGKNPSASKPEPAVRERCCCHHAVLVDGVEMTGVAHVSRRRRGTFKG